METLREVLRRTEKISEEDAEKKIESIKHRLLSSESPSDVLVDEFGNDVQKLKEILTPEDYDENA